MDNSGRRKALAGAEKETLDLIADVLTPHQWAELLKVPLERAIANGNVGLARALAEAGAEVGEALHMAILGGHEEIAKYLLENGASVDAEDSEGDKPLFVAAQEGQTEIVRLLLLKGADVDGDGIEETPLCRAVRECHEPAALALVDAGAEVNVYIGCKFERPAVSVAAMNGQMGILRVLIERGADVNAADALGNTSLHFAAECGQMEILRVLIERGADVNATDIVSGGETPLHFAARYAQLEILRVLIERGADVNATTRLGKTPLHFAVAIAGEEGSAPEIVDSLLRGGADETILGDKFRVAADMPQGVQRVQQLLVNAQADRTWRRRGYLVMCRTHSDRVHQILPESIGNWSCVMVKVLGLHDEGIFRTIVGYL